MTADNVPTAQTNQTGQQDQVETPVRSAAARPILVATSILGAFALLSVGTSAAFAAADNQMSSSLVSAGSIVGDTTGVDEVTIDASRADFTLSFADVAEANLEAIGPGSDRWTMRREGNELKIEGPRRVMGFCFIGMCGREEQTVSLVLPRELEDRLIDVDAKLGAGRFQADGNFRDLEFEVGAGEMTVNGSARSLGLEMGAGDFTADLADVSEADLDVSAGTARVSFTGTVPSEVDVEVSAGSVDLTLPSAAYRVETKASAGSVDNKLRTDSTSRNLVSAKVSAGEIILRQGK